MRYTYSKDYPRIQRLQGGILYPHNIEQVEVPTENGTEETHYRYFLLKFSDTGQDISDLETFKAQNAEAIQQYLDLNLDVQQVSECRDDWKERLKRTIDLSVVEQIPFQEHTS